MERITLNVGQVKILLGLVSGMEVLTAEYRKVLRAGGLVVTQAVYSGLSKKAQADFDALLKAEKIGIDKVVVDSADRDNNKAKISAHSQEGAKLIEALYSAKKAVDLYAEKAGMEVEVQIAIKRK